MTTLTWPLPADPSAPALARQVVGQALGDSTHRDDALLVTSELVTNAVTHGRPPVTLHLQIAADHVRVAVVDRGAGFTAGSDDDDPLAPSGRGLGIIASVARECGSRQTDQGWESWAVLGPSSDG